MCLKLCCALVVTLLSSTIVPGSGGDLLAYSYAGALSFVQATNIAGSAATTSTGATTASPPANTTSTATTANSSPSQTQVQPPAPPRPATDTSEENLWKQVSSLWWVLLIAAFILLFIYPGLCYEFLFSDADTIEEANLRDQEFILKILKHGPPAKSDVVARNDAGEVEVNFKQIGNRFSSWSPGPAGSNNLGGAAGNNKANSSSAGPKKPAHGVGGTRRHSLVRKDQPDHSAESTARKNSFVTQERRWSEATLESSYDGGYCNGFELFQNSVFQATFNYKKSLTKKAVASKNKTAALIATVSGGGLGGSSKTTSNKTPNSNLSNNKTPSTLFSSFTKAEEDAAANLETACYHRKATNWKSTLDKGYIAFTNFNPAAQTFTGNGTDERNGPFDVIGRYDQQTGRIWWKQIFKQRISSRGSLFGLGAEAADHGATADQTGRKLTIDDGAEPSTQSTVTLICVAAKISTQTGRTITGRFIPNGGLNRGGVIHLFRKPIAAGDPDKYNSVFSVTGVKDLGNNNPMLLVENEINAGRCGPSSSLDRSMSGFGSSSRTPSRYYASAVNPMEVESVDSYGEHEAQAANPTRNGPSGTSTSSYNAPPGTTMTGFSPALSQQSKKSSKSAAGMKSNKTTTSATTPSASAKKKKEKKHSKRSKRDELAASKTSTLFNRSTSSLEEFVTDDPVGYRVSTSSSKKVSEYGMKISTDVFEASSGHSPLFMEKHRASIVQV
ncbi:unnamed protein product [Amoebophrya sp. A120]|nr:unnamed protein product [Amoebophrya sp. A120]|eukprot:GSA120T00014068001.1